MLISRVLTLTTLSFAFFSLYALFYSLYQTQLKFHDTSDLNILIQDNSTEWFKPKVKVVMVIVDALRFDFLLNYKNIDQDPLLKNHKFRSFNQAFYKHPEKFVVVRAKADIPTMTILRVPCLMTGNVPRLGSVLTAFGALPAEEDSIPRQIYRQNRTSYFSGDPILKEYFPKYIKSENKINSFNVRDEHVDDISHNYIFQKLKEKSFDFLITHLLRLDHMAHVTNLYSPQVRLALDDIDKFLVRLMNTIDDNTMLLIAGDHGMTVKGRHGGDSKQERHTAIVAYHKKGFKKYKGKSSSLKRVMRSVNETIEQVHQIDLVPTLAMLMGLPTPFSNMGQILNDFYPSGDYFDHHPKCPKTTTFEPAFDMQLLHDNHLNTLQVWNYFKKYHEGQSLFTSEEFANVTKLFQETEAFYKAAQELISQSRQCEDSFHTATVHAIERSQQLSNDIYRLVQTKTPHDLVIFWQALTILALVVVSFILLIQYLYNTKDSELIEWKKPESWTAKTLISTAIVLTLIWICMLSNSPRMMRPITSTVLGLAIYLVGSSVLFLFSKPRDNNPYDAVNTSEVNAMNTTEVSLEKQQKPSLITLESFFILQSPFISIGAAILIVYLFYLTHVFVLDKYYFTSRVAYTPAVFALFASARFFFRYFKVSHILIALPFIFAITQDFAHIPLLATEEHLILMALLLIADWLYAEFQFSLHKLKAGKLWSAQYLIPFIALVYYHYIKDPTTEYVQITLPRLIWVMLSLSSIAGFLLCRPWKIIKRNIQVNFVLFLILMQMHRKLLYFAIFLSLMRIVSFVFKNAKFRNYLYPLVMGLISYVGLFSLGYQDRKLPRSFEQAFVGVHDFHLGFSLFLFSCAFLSTIILGMLFMSFYSQDLELQEVELGKKNEEELSYSKLLLLKEIQIS